MTVSDLHPRTTNESGTAAFALRHCLYGKFVHVSPRAYECMYCIDDSSLTALIIAVAPQRTSHTLVALVMMHRNNLCLFTREILRGQGPLIDRVFNISNPVPLRRSQRSRPGL